MPRTILVIDDEPDLRQLLDYNLTRENYLVLTAADGPTGLALARRHRPNLILLDVMLPGLDGWEMCRQLRQDPVTAGVPILLLTCRAEEADRVLGLELGADDFVTKPFGVRELLARVKAILRRTEGGPPTPGPRKTGEIVIDTEKRTVTVEGGEISLTATEFNLLHALANREGCVLSREDLITAACGEDATVLDRTIDVHMVALRRKLGKAGKRIETVRGVGYRLKE